MAPQRRVRGQGTIAGPETAARSWPRTVCVALVLRLIPQVANGVNVSTFHHLRVSKFFVFRLCTRTRSDQAQRRRRMEVSGEERS